MRGIIRKKLGPKSRCRKGLKGIYIMFSFTCDKVFQMGRLLNNISSFGQRFSIAIFKCNILTPHANFLGPTYNKLSKKHTSYIVYSASFCNCPIMMLLLVDIYTSQECREPCIMSFIVITKGDAWWQIIARTLVGVIWYHSKITPHGCKKCCTKHDTAFDNSYSLW